MVRQHVRALQRIVWLAGCRGRANVKSGAAVHHSGGTRPKPADAPGEKTTSSGSGSAARARRDQNRPGQSGTAGGWGRE